jgi:hypothetical protein
MCEVASRTQRINGVDVEIWEYEIIDANILSVEAGTNCYHGGDTSGIEIALGGNTELSTIIEAFKFITKVLEEGREAAL